MSQATTDQRPSLQEGISNQLRGTCGGSGWRYLGGEALGWWVRCKGCDGCAAVH